MAISSYSELIDAVSSWLNRPELDQVVPSLIALAEADMSRRVRHWQMEKRATLSISGQFTAIPADWVETIRLYTTAGGTAPVELVSRAEMMEFRSAMENTAGKPRFYTMSAGQFEFAPTPDGTYSADLLYVSQIPALSSGSPTNWLLSTAPDAYLYGTLFHSSPYLQDDARSVVWAQLYQSAIDGLNAASNDAKYSGSGLRMKTRSY
jgi:hypothetical protein